MHQNTDEELTDAELVQLAVRGDQCAFGQLYDRYAPLIRARCYDKTKNLHDAQELCQEVFLRAFAKLKTLQDSGKFSSWLIGIQSRVCQEKSRSAIHERGSRSHSDVDSLAAPEDNRQGGALARALARLSERQRAALHAFYLLGQDAEKARNVLKLSRSGFYKLLRQSREELVRIIQKGE